MTPLAAYYVMVLTENERKNQVPSEVTRPSRPSRPSLSERIAKALASRPRPGRSTSAQAA